MKVRDLMTRTVQSCESSTNLAEVAELMWKADCGVRPVVDAGKFVGILTDRDICIALGTRNLPAAEITAGEVAMTGVVTCAPGSDVHAAMTLMRKAKVRRLPVVEDGQVEGILALNNMLDAVDRGHGAIDYEEVKGTMKAICEHRSHASAAAA